MWGLENHLVLFIVSKDGSSPLLIHHDSSTTPCVSISRRYTLAKIHSISSLSRHVDYSGSGSMQNSWRYLIEKMGKHEYDLAPDFRACWLGVPIINAMGPA